MTLDEIKTRYPYLIQAMLYAACLSEGEAAACIRDYRSGLPYSGEAVNHYGGTKLVLQAAARQRVWHYMLDCRTEQRHQQDLAHAQRECMNQTGRL